MQVVNEGDTYRKLLKVMKWGGSLFYGIIQLNNSYHYYRTGKLNTRILAVLNANEHCTLIIKSDHLHY